MHHSLTPSLAILATAGILAVIPWAAQALSAQSVPDYQPGLGFAVEFGSGLGYTNTQSVLGLPNRDTTYGGVTPFNPPFERSELISLGQGGSLLVELEGTIWNDPGHPFGIDFIIYGSAGFIDIAYPNGLADESASMFGQNLGQTRVWVSADNVDYFMLDPSLAPVADGLFPTDGAGQFGRPVDPGITQSDLAGLTLEQIRQRYNGSAGGTGYDLAWALDGSGQPVDAGAVRYIRVDVLSGRAELDAIVGVTVVPEPGMTMLAGLGLAALWFRRRLGHARAR